MNWLRRFWNWFTTPKDGFCCNIVVEPTLVEVEEENIDIGGVFDTICRKMAIKPKDMADEKAIFLEQYTGLPDEESVRDGIRAMCETNDYMAYMFLNRKGAGNL